MNKIKQMNLIAYYGYQFVEERIPVTGLCVTTPDPVKAPYSEDKRA